MLIYTYSIFTLFQTSIFFFMLMIKKLGKVKRFLSGLIPNKIFFLNNTLKQGQQRTKDPLICTIEAQYHSARVLILTLPHGNVYTPTYMPVGTKGAMKGITQFQMQKLNCNILLANTYHLAASPGTEYIEKVGGLHRFAGWNRNILTDSGGYQMVSFGKLIEVEQEGVHFDSPYGQQRIFLRPQDSIKAQNEIGADIIMAFDDVIKTTTKGQRLNESVYRTSRWFDRCWKAHSKQNTQNLFPIIQGATNLTQRQLSLQALMKTNAKGYAIGGLSGGENKVDFFRTVKQCCQKLPKDRPRYLMGVGYPIDLVLCAALGVDMFDCVFATRTARFGRAFTSEGQIDLKNSNFINDFQPIENGCQCQTCLYFSKAYLTFIRKQDNFSHLVSIHNVHFLLKTMEKLRNSIKESRLQNFIEDFINNIFKRIGYIPEWVEEALNLAEIKVKLSLPLSKSHSNKNGDKIQFLKQ